MKTADSLVEEKLSTEDSQGIGVLDNIIFLIKQQKEELDFKI